MVEPGRRCLGDRYELHQLIAAGGMGQVWRGLDIALHRPVAVKVLRSEYTGDPTFVARFRAEAQHAASLSHPNIAAVFDYGEEIAQDGTGETLAYLVMELVEGEPLSALVAREGPLDCETTLSLLRQTAFGLGEAHRAGMVHRDVKPGNILVRPDGGVKITDFGIAWSARSVALTKTGQVIGTPQYLSPEQAEGRLATPASDIYALGLIGYECLAGHPAFQGDNAVTIALMQVRQDPAPLPIELPVGIRTLIGRAVAKDPAARLADGDAFVGAIDDIQAGRVLSPAPVTGGVPAPRPPEETQVSGAVARPPAARRRGRVATALLPLLALLVGAGIALALVQSLAGEPPRSTAEAAEQRDTGSIVLDADDYIGQPIDVVTQRLTDLGLDVVPRPEPRDDVVPDQVVDVDPAGTPLSAGARVVVTFAVLEADDGGRRDGAVVTGAAGGGGGGTPTAEATESIVGEDAAEPTATEAAEPTTLPGTAPESEPGPGPNPDTGEGTDASPTPDTGGDTGTGGGTAPSTAPSTESSTATSTAPSTPSAG
ncbi:MAG: pknA2 [Blastococcus sp.]|nr:pknA2 [Blastococcus sp.]